MLATIADDSTFVRVGKGNGRNLNGVVLLCLYLRVKIWLASLLNCGHNTEVR